MKRSKIDDAEWLQAGEVGYEVLSRGPEAFVSKLKEIQLSEPVDNRLHRDRYRIFYDWIRNRDDDLAFDVIRDLVREFVWSNFPVSEGTVVLGKPSPKQRIHSSATAAKAFGVTRWKLESRMVALGLAYRTSERSRAVADDYSSASAIESIANEIKSFIRGRDAAEMLGIDLSLLRSLVKGGLVPQAMMVAKNAPYYLPSDIDAFLLRLWALVSPRPFSDGDITLMAAACRCQCSTNDIIELVLRKRIPLTACSCSKPKLSDLRVALTNIQSALARDRDDTLSLAEVASILKIDTVTVRSLLRRKFLLAVEGPSGTTNRWHIVSRASVDDFQQRFVSLKALSIERKKKPAILALELYAQGIRPIDIGTKGQRIFKLADL